MNTPLRQLQPAGRAAPRPATSSRRQLVLLGVAFTSSGAAMAPTSLGAPSARPAPPRATVSDTIDADDYNKQWIEVGGTHRTCLVGALNAT